MTKIESIKNTLSRIQDNCTALVMSPENRKYLTGFESSDGFLLINASDAIFITDGRYIEAAENTVRDCKVLLQEHNLWEQIKKLMSDMKVEKLLLESSRTTMHLYRILSERLNETEIIADDSLDSIIGEMRAVKDENEIRNIKAAQKITDEAFSHICKFIKEGMTEKEIQLELDFYMLSHGGEALSFETIAVSGKNSSMPHGVPGFKKVENGDFITMDFGTIVNGYHSDMTRTVVLAGVSEKMKKVYNTVLKAQMECINSIKAGMSGAQGDKISRDVIEKEGFGEYFTHSTGHSVGIEIHEPPFLNTSEESILKPGMVVTVEPGIYIPGEFGVRIEDMVVITENGCEDLTGSKKELIIL